MAWGEAVGHGRGSGAWEHLLLVVWLFGCLAAVGVLHMFFAILFKWCAMRAKANAVKPERAYMYPLGRELYNLVWAVVNNKSSRSRRCCILVPSLGYRRSHWNKLFLIMEIILVYYPFDLSNNTWHQIKYSLNLNTIFINYNLFKVNPQKHVPR